MQEFKIGPIGERTEQKAQLKSIKGDKTGTEETFANLADWSEAQPYEQTPW